MKQITEDYVSFETAKLLKQKGFSENTICKYADTGGITEQWYDNYRERLLHFDYDEGYLIEPQEPKEQYEIIGDTISAPTLQMTMKWLREVHGIIITIDFDEYELTSDNKKVGYGWNIQKVEIPTEYFKISTMAYDTYEEAVEAAIKHCLTNLIEL